MKAHDELDNAVTKLMNSQREIVLTYPKTVTFRIKWRSSVNIIRHVWPSWLAAASGQEAGQLGEGGPVISALQFATKSVTRCAASATVKQLR